MTERELVDECVTLFAAGHETTASALTFTLWLPRSSPHPVVVRYAGRAYRVAPGARVPVRIALPHPGPWSASFAVVSGGSALRDGRPVSVRATAPVLAAR